MMNFDSIFSLVPLVVFLPLLGLLINLLFGQKLGEKFTGIMASLATGLAFVVSILLAVGLNGTPNPAPIKLFDWITLGSFSASWTFRVDTLSVVMMLVVSGVGTLIHIYSIGYMHSDVRHNNGPERFRRFFLFLNLFIAAMMILVSADNFLMLFVGWEGVGLCSYLLIGFWFEKGKNGTGNAEAAKKAFITNRIGDFGLLMAMFLIFWNFGSLDFATVFAAAPSVAAEHPTVMLLITLFMLLGVTGKSAQLPLFVWLPDAMAGPTPVSALIHAATMVTAGVYLVARSSAFYTLVPAAQTVVMWVGAATALFAATIAVAQNDIKKVLAYSTISQLGFMVTAVGMGATVAGMFHLVTHAFFKALLFLAAGSVIQGVERGLHHQKSHSELDPQDMRNMGGLRKQMPVTFWVYLIGGLTLAGLAPLAGFFSKDEILAAASQEYSSVFVVLIIAAFFTAFYIGRQIIMVFFGKPRTSAAAEASESPAVVTVPLLILALLSVLGGLLNFPGNLALEKWLAHTLGELHAEGFHWSVAAASFALALLGLGLAWLLYGRKPLAKDQPDPLQKGLGPVYTGMARKWWVDEFYGLVVLTPYKAIAQFFAKPVDLGVIDGAGKGLAVGTSALGTWLRRFQNGYLRSYAMWMLVGLVAILTYLVLR
jgi:NADH-quinone oxidoreductase subunit L